jgi:hypothetical protein
MIDFLQHIPAAFYYGMVAASLMVIVVSVVAYFISCGDIVTGILCGILWPATICGVVFVLCAEAYDDITNFLYSRRDNVTFFERENKKHLECSDDELIVEVTSLDDILTMHSILKEHDIRSIGRPATKWNIFPRSCRVRENLMTTSYKISFNSVEDKATFQFYWESLR